MKKIIFLLLFVYVSIGTVQATHIRAGDLTAVRVSTVGLSYEFTVTIYTDDGGIEPDRSIIINFGTGGAEVAVPLLSSRPIRGDTHINIYKVVHTFAGPGEFKISTTIQNRNANVINIENSVNTAFAIESTFLITPFLGLNSSPVLKIPPLDRAAVGQRFVHNPGAVDAEGDSLSYRLTICKRAANKEIENYVVLNDPRFKALTEDGSAPATLVLDPITGDLIWNAPLVEGEYNVAFFVDEWRNGVKIGSVNRDMQILVRPNPNKRPILNVKDTCIVAGTFFEGEVISTDPDKDRVSLEAFGELFDLKSPSNKATFDTIRSQPPLGKLRGLLKWQTTCQDVRPYPYTVVFRTEDFPLPSINKLVDIASWRIRVVAPAPEGLLATPDNIKKSVTLSWNNYKCPNATKMTVWRREGSFAFTTAPCNTGLPDGSYTKIGELDINNLQLIDDNGGKGLVRGKTYCYRIYAVFPKGDESFASQEVCVSIKTAKPRITNVSIEKTDTQNGEIFVKWTKPLAIDTAAFQRPYTYQIARARGFNGTVGYQLINQTFTEKDTFFTDKSLNTTDLIHNYRVYFYAKNVLIDSSEVASSVRLLATPTAKTISLSWQFETPWNNNTSAKHFIFREKQSQKGTFDLIDSVNVTQNGFNYLDEGKFNTQKLEPQIQYCYYVQTVGSYEDLKNLKNKSQIICASLIDTVRTAAIITNVSIQSTDTKTGEILVKWLKPLRLDQKRTPPPYSYRLYRSSNGTNFLRINQIFTLNDTVFTDKQRNTTDSTYFYKVEIYSKDSLIATSKTASSVRLTASSSGKNAVLSWKATTPWNNQSTKFRFHYVYKERNNQQGVFDLIDSVNVATSGFNYTDTQNLLENQTYCYYVTTKGTYSMDSVPEPLLNNSQKVCIQVKDITAPCPPVLSLKTLDCGILDQNPKLYCGKTFENPLNWLPNRSQNCDANIKEYKLYYKRFEDGTFELLKTLKDTFFVHQNLQSVAGCYAVSALDSDGNESALSNTVCNDNCPYYALPNVITPNGDKENDVFRPMDCPRFVEKVIFTVFNRWGQLVYSSENDTLLNWTGVNQSGEALSGGMYYYEARISFVRLSPTPNPLILRGWVHILR